MTLTDPTPPPRIWRSLPVIRAAMLVTVWLGVRTIVQGDWPLVDELQHQGIIQDFVNGRWHLPDDLPMLPVYHAMVAGVEWALGPGLFVGRLFSVCMALAGFAAYGLLSQKVRAGRWSDSFRLYAYHPLMFPFTAMIYTEQTSVSLLVFALLAHAGGRFGWAAVAMAAAAILRQTNLVWVIVLVAWAVSDSLGQSALPNGRAKIKEVSCCLLSMWRYAVVILAAGAFVIGNGRLTAGVAPLNQPAFNIAQYYVFFLFVLALWAPVFIDRAVGDIRALLLWSVRCPVAAGVAGVMGAALIVVLFINYSNPHPWNHGTNLVRNWPLLKMDQSGKARLLVLLVCAWSIYQTVRFTLTRKNLVILAAIWGGGLLSLSIMGLVEPRYYIPILLLADFFNDYEPRHAAWLARWYQCAAAAICLLSLTCRFW
jgi:alpha-1,2-glucosyltransferase